MTELIGPIARGDVEFLAPRYRRHPRDGVLITQFVPRWCALIRRRARRAARRGVRLLRTLCVALSRAGYLESRGRGFAVDLWLRTEALAKRFLVGQIGVRRRRRRARTTLREVVRQVVLSLIESLRAHESFWLKADGIAELRTWGTDPIVVPDAARGTTRPWPSTPVTTSSRSSRCSRKCSSRTSSRDSWMTARARTPGSTTSSGCGACMRSPSRRLGRTSIEHLADMFAPLYMWRASPSWRTPRSESPAIVQARLDSLCETFLRLKPALVARWSAEV